MTAPFRRSWFQYSLKTMMAAVVVICLGPGGWHLLLKYGQYVEAEPALVGQPIKIRGRFIHLGGEAPDLGGWPYVLDVFPIAESGTGIAVHGYAEYVGWCIYGIEDEFIPEGSPDEFTMTLTPRGGSAVEGRFHVRAAD